MSYSQAMRWSRKHPKGTRQPVLMHTDSGFWPSGGYLREDYWPYRAACEAIGVEPLECKQHYDLQCRGGSLCGLTPEDQAAWTKEAHA